MANITLLLTATGLPTDIELSSFNVKISGVVDLGQDVENVAILKDLAESGTDVSGDDFDEYREHNYTFEVYGNLDAVYTFFCHWYLYEFADDCHKQHLSEMIKFINSY